MLLNREPVKSWSPELCKSARRKMIMVDAAVDVNDLKFPPGNRLKKLKGNRKGQYSVRVNDQWRICFEWRDGNAYKAELTDYHK